MRNKWDVLVLGAGVNGLATAYHLSRYKDLNVCLVDQFSIGHPFGGSHGASRIIRSTYSDPAFLRLIKRVREIDWPELEREAGCSLIHPNPGCFFGDGSTFERYVQSVIQCGLDIEVLDVAKAKQLFPQFQFKNIATVLHDRTSGVIAAKETMEHLRRLIGDRVDIFENTKVLNLDSSRETLQILTDRGDFFSDRLVITAGAWMKKIVPSVTVLRQNVAYLKVQGESRFPCWSFIGDGDNQIFYGLPQNNELKISMHATVGQSDDPDSKITTADPAQIEILLEFAKEHFVPKIERVVSSDTCLYANLPNEAFIIDPMPNDKRIVIGSACSGHGFKFAPLAGRLLAELVLFGKTTVPEFEQIRSSFRL